MWKLVKKDVLRLRKHPGGFILTTLAPLVTAFLMLLVFGGGNNVTLRVTLAVENSDDSMAASFLQQAFSRGELAEMFVLKNVEDAQAAVEDDQASAGLIIPENFQSKILAHEPVSLQLYKNPSQSYSPKIAEETMLILSEGLDRLLHIAEEPIAQMNSQMQVDDIPSEQDIATVSVAFFKIVRELQPFLEEPPVELQETEISQDEEKNDQNIIFLFILAGVSVMFLLFSANGMAEDYFKERTNFTMQRIITSPAGRTNYVLSKHVYLVISATVSFYIVWAIAFVLNGVSLDNFFKFFILSIFIVNAIVAVINFCYSLIKTRNQANAIMPAVTIILSVIGGGMIPMHNLPPFVHKIAVISPVYWGVDALQKIFIENAKFIDLNIHFIMLTTFAVVLSVLAILIQQRRLSV